MSYLMRVRARTFALIYLALIPGYAAVYSALPYHFHHSTAMYEPSITADAKQIEADLQKAIVSGIREHYHSDSAKTPNITVSEQSVAVSFVKAERYGVIFNISFDPTFTENGRKEGAVTPGGFRVSLSLLPFGDTKGNGDEIYCLSLEHPEQESASFKLHDLCPVQPGFGIGIFGNVDGFIVLPKRVQLRIFAYAEAHRGFPSFSSGQFSRMFYLSAVTITTVGFGDIVPVTDFARALVASEAILGVVTAGLFLNAIAQRIAREAKSDG